MEQVKNKLRKKNNQTTTTKKDKHLQIPFSSWNVVAI